MNKSSELIFFKARLVLEALVFLEIDQVQLFILYLADFYNRKKKKRSWKALIPYTDQLQSQLR